jgi:uncharacterized protein YciI
METEYNKELCMKTHEEITAELADHKLRLNKHGADIETLKISGATLKQIVDNISGKLDSQTKALWGIFILIAGQLIYNLFK